MGLPTLGLVADRSFYTPQDAVVWSGPIFTALDSVLDDAREKLAYMHGAIAWASMAFAEGGPQRTAGCSHWSIRPARTLLAITKAEHC